MSDAEKRYKNEETLRRLYHEEGLSGREIAERLDCGKRTVFRWMEKHGIPRKDKVQAIKEHHRKEYANYRMDNDGHYVWLAAHDGKNEKMYVARLLAIAEYGVDAVAGNHVHHKNEIPWDNRPENLEVMSAREHMIHHLKGEQHPNAKLSNDEVREIKKMYNNTDKTQKEVGEEFGVSHQYVSSVVNGGRWGHL